MPDITIHNIPALKKEELLRESPLFSCLNDSQMIEICRNINQISLKEGEILFNQGDSFTRFFLVVSGLIKLYRHSPSGQEKIIELEGSGRTFAEALMFYENNNYPVTAMAMQSTSLLAINAKSFMELLKKSPDTCIMVLADLSRRLHELIHEIEHLSLLTGRNRVSMYLMDQSLIKGKEFKLDIPKNAIASMLSLKPETFSRLLKELCTQQIITVNDSHINVLDHKLLQEYAGVSEH